MNTGLTPFYLFLDFDGVLHRAGEHAILFEHADRLGEVLTAFPEVHVVVSSSWREVFPLEQLHEFCGPVVGARICDVTPVLRQADAEPWFERFEEIRAWFALNAPRPDPRERDDWAALDDSIGWYPPACRQLIHVADRLGLGDAHLEALRARLQAHRRRETP